MDAKYFDKKLELFDNFKTYLLKLKKEFTHPALPSNLQEIALNGVKRGTGRSLSEWINKVNEWLNYEKVLLTGDKSKMIDGMYDISDNWIKALYSFEKFIDNIPKSALRLSQMDQTEKDLGSIISGKKIIRELLNYIENYHLHKSETKIETEERQDSRSLPPAKRLLGVGFPGGTLYWYSLKVSNLYTNDDKGGNRIKNVSFQVNKNSIYGIYGPTGSGKTSILECITGIRTYLGEIVYFGKKNNDYKSVSKNIAVQWQKSELEPGITVREFLRSNGNLSIYNNKSDFFMEIEKKKDLEIINLPYHYLIILNLVKLLSYDPDLIILDDITDGLNFEEKQKIWQIIINIKKTGKTVLLTSSDFKEVSSICSEVLDLTKLQYR